MVNVEVENSKASVTGDFFIEPAEAREEIESVLESLEKDVSDKQIIEELESVEAQLIGFAAEDVAEAFQKARGEEE